MIIHVVQSGETIDSIAKAYRVPVERLIQDNELTNPDHLVVGQTIVILYPALSYTVQEGDTLKSIADVFGITEMQLLRNNPLLSERETLYKGETVFIKITEIDTMKISTNGYSYPFISNEILRRTLPFLTYLTIFDYTITKDGIVIQCDDTDTVQIAKEYGVAPLMLIATFTSLGKEDSEMAHAILISIEIQNQLIEQILTILEEKGYYGINMDSQVVHWEDRQLYVDFVRNITKRLNDKGYQVFVTITPQTFIQPSGQIYRDHEFEVIGQAANGIMLLSYEWGHILRSPSTIASIDSTKEDLDYITSQILPEKISIGIPVIGYDWGLPYETGVSNTQSLSYDSIINLAVSVGATILFDETSQAPYFYYTVTIDDKEVQHIVWFKDARSIDALVKLVPEYGLKGVGIWNIMYYFAQMWLVINSQYEIDKII